MTGTPHDVSHDDFVEALLNYVNAALRASPTIAKKPCVWSMLATICSLRPAFTAPMRNRASMPCAIFAHSTTKPWNGVPIEHVVPQWHVILDYKCGLSPQQSNYISPS